jgi:osmotically-inducible protein OsmY
MQKDTEGKVVEGHAGPHAQRKNRLWSEPAREPAASDRNAPMIKKASDSGLSLSALAVLLASVCGCACQRAPVVAQTVPSGAAAFGLPPTANLGVLPTTGPSPGDLALQSVVYTRIIEDSKVEQQGFTVSITDGIVGLTGRVDNVLSRDRATRLAEAVRGVRAVDNRMEIVPEKRADADIESDLLKALLYNAATAKMPIHAQVRNGVARLTGTVNSWQEQELAERIADDVRGVRFTQNDLATKRTPTRLDSAIAGDIKTRFVWDVLI